MVVDSLTYMSDAMYILVISFVICVSIFKN